jgi:glycosyltransferase involved in cell wall biosynthesis
MRASLREQLHAITFDQKTPASDSLRRIGSSQDKVELLVLSQLPLVAIATPVYNGGQFLEEAMACVQAQTYPNLVHCVLDNASTDATAEIIDRFRDKRVPLITARNEQTIPMLENWNAVVRLIPNDATYFRVLPADDLMAPTCLEKMIAIGEENPTVSVLGCQEWHGDALVGTDLPTDSVVFDGRAIARGSLRNEIHGFPHLHCVYRKEVGPAPARFYETEFHNSRLLAIDMDAALRALAEGSYGQVHEPLVTTRLHNDSVTAAVSAPNAIKLWSELQLIDRWGPSVFDSKQDYLECRHRHLMFYYRHLLMWKAKGRKQIFQQHMDWLNKASAAPGLMDYGRSIADWPLKRFQRKPLRTYSQVNSTAA